MSRGCKGPEENLAEESELDNEDTEARACQCPSHTQAGTRDSVVSRVKTRAIEHFAIDHDDQGHRQRRASRPLDFTSLPSARH